MSQFLNDMSAFSQEDLVYFKSGLKLLEELGQRVYKEKARRERNAKLTQVTGPGEKTQPSAHEKSSNASPTSKTDLGKLTYNIARLPSLFIVDVQVDYEAKQVPEAERAAEKQPPVGERPGDTTWQRVLKRDVRTEALNELLAKEFKAVKDAAVINTRAPHLMDQIIIPIEQLSRLGLEWEEDQKKFKELSVYKLAKTRSPFWEIVPPKQNQDTDSLQEKPKSKNSKRTMKSKPVQCTITGCSTLTAYDRDEKLYEKALLSLIFSRARSLATPDDINGDATCTPPHEVSEYSKEAATMLGDTKTRDFFFNIPPGKDIAYFNPRLPGCINGKGIPFFLRLRAKLTFDRKLNALQLAYDLAAGIPSIEATTPNNPPAIRLYDVLYSVFGPKLTQNNVSKYIHLIKQILGGLKVKRNYAPASKTRLAEAFTINAFMLDADGEKTKNADKNQTVFDYLKKEYDIDTLHRYLPLVSADNMCWFPIEHLVVCPGQHIADADALVPKLRHEMPKITGADLDQYIRTTGKVIIEAINENPVGSNKGTGDLLLRSNKNEVPLFPMDVNSVPQVNIAKMDPISLALL